MPLAVTIPLALALSYLLGGIPWALVIGKRVYGVDLREQGSGNLGATNVFRVLGVKAAVIVGALDVTKGVAAASLAYALVPPSAGQAAHGWALVGATLAAMLGHAYSPYIGFCGGKSVAVAAGALLVMTPLAWPFLLGTFILVVLVSKRVSLGSMVIAAEFPVLVLVFYGDDLPFVVFSFAAAALVLWRHRSNMARIARGTEPRISLRRASEGAQSGEGTGEVR